MAPRVLFASTTILMKFDFLKKILSGYVAAFLLLLVSYILAINAILQLRKQNQWVGHTREVINKLEMMVSYLKDGEIGLRGLIMMKDEKFFLPYYTSQRKVDSLYNILNVLISDNDLEKERLIALRGFLDKKFNILSDQIDSLRNSHLEVNDFIRSRAFESKMLMDSIRFTAGLMENREEELLKIRTNNVSSYNSVLYTLIVISFVISILLIGYSLITLMIENRAKKKATIEAEGYHEQLEKRVEELRQVNQELMELRSLETFSSTGRIARVIAHEVKNPLTNIDLAAAQIDADHVSAEDKKSFIEIIARNSKRINFLINDLLNATRFSELKYEDVNINELLDETLDDAKDRAQLKKIAIEKKYAKGIPVVQVDKIRMKSAFLNVIVNAIEAMPEEKGVLLIETGAKGENCIINISDNGKGMGYETLSRIFDPYFTSKKKGSGLGLTITQNIILNHKGKIQASSEPGKGTVFTIFLRIKGADNPA